MVVRAVGSDGFGGGDLGPALCTLSLEACERFVGARKAFPSETGAKLGGHGASVLFGGGMVQNSPGPDLQSARVFRQPHRMPWLGAGVCKPRGKN